MLIQCRLDAGSASKIQKQTNYGDITKPFTEFIKRERRTGSVIYADYTCIDKHEEISQETASPLWESGILLWAGVHVSLAWKHLLLPMTRRKTGGKPIWTTSE